MKILFGSMSSHPIHFMKTGMLLHLLESTDWVTAKKQHIETHLNQGIEFLYWQNLTDFEEILKSAQIFNDLLLFSPFGICLNDYGYLIVMFSAIYT